MFQKALEKRRNGDSGFTLIELLVVVIIIGILAAIAIPIFISQQEKAKIAAVKSDLKNAAIAATAYATDNNGSYAGLNLVELGLNDYTATADVALAVVGPAQGSFCLEAFHSFDPAQIWHVDSDTATAVLEGAC